MTRCWMCGTNLQSMIDQLKEHVKTRRRKGLRVVQGGKTE
jgi:hypothetical protein